MPTQAAKTTTTGPGGPLPTSGQIYAKLNYEHPRPKGVRNWGAHSILAKIAERHGLKPDTLYRVCQRIRHHEAAERDIEAAAKVPPGTFFPLKEGADA